VSNALAIAGVTAVLQNLLGSLNADLTTALGVGVDMPALAPEEILQKKLSNPALNLFLYQVTPNGAWRNVGFPSVDWDGNRTTRPPLAVDLHYLLTAYGHDDLQAEVLLGYAMRVLHENPVLTRTTIRAVLNPSPPPPHPSAMQAALQTTGLADQIEQIKIAPAVLNLEELSKLWTALQANYRPSVAYLITVVLIETNKPERSPLPVLSRGPVDPVTHRETGIQPQPNLLSPYPEIESISPATGQIAAQVGDTLTVSGTRLNGAVGAYILRLSNVRLGAEAEITPEVGGTGSESAVQFVLNVTSATVLNVPSATIPAGIYTAELSVQKPGEPKPRHTNSIPLTIAPQLQAGSLPASVTLGGGTTLTLTPTCVPDVFPGQRVSLLLGGYEALADPFAAPTANPSFTFNDVLPDRYWVRLRVDGIDSLLVDPTTMPPSFIGPRLTVLP
jgi:uncharacterized protein DUF4255